jgi:FlaA1/EpsC-like NDP-sugar epimerase
MKALSMAQMANYTIPEDIEIEFVGMRPGEKRHEIIITPEEKKYVEGCVGGFLIHPTTIAVREFISMKEIPDPYSSEHAKRLSKEQLLQMIGE